MAKKQNNNNLNVILTRQTCGQRLGMGAASKHQALTFYFPVRICFKFRMSKCRRESDLDLCMTLGLAKRMPLRSADFLFLKVFGRNILRKRLFSSFLPHAGGWDFRSAGTFCDGVFYP